MDIFSSAASGIAINLATIIVQNYVQGLDNTPAGQTLRKIGLNKPTLHDKLRQTLGEAFLIFQRKGPQYNLKDLKDFFRDPQVGRSICNTILLYKGVPSQELQVKLDEYFRKDGILSREFQANGGIPEKVFSDFFKSYNEVLLQHVDIGDVATINTIFDDNRQITTEIQKSRSQHNDSFDELKKLIEDNTQLILNQLSNIPPSNSSVVSPSQSALPPRQSTTQPVRDNSQRSISDIARTIHNMRFTREPIVLFLGAKTSGLYNNHKLYADIRADSTRSAEWDTLTDTEKFHESYRVLQTYPKAEVDTLLRTALLDAPLYRNEDAILAKLIRDGYFSTIVCTGIDVFLENALNKEKLQTYFDYRLIKYRSESADVDYTAQPYWTGCKVIKLFGDIQSSRFNTPEHEFELDSQENVKLRDYLEGEQVFSKSVLMIGYNISWDAPLRSAFLPSRKGLIYYVNEEAPTADVHMLNVITKRGKRFSGTQKSFAAFIKELQNELQMLDPSN